MSRKILCVALVVLALEAIGANGASASGRGAGNSHPGGSAATGLRAGSGNCPANSGRFLPVENGIHRPTCVYPGRVYENAYCGWRGTGYGYGNGIGYDFGYGCGYPGWGYLPSALGYELEGVPYFAQFPPVYYGSGENLPNWNTSVRSFSAGSESPQPATESAASANPSRPPLRIINPYCVDGKADQP